MWIAYVPQYQRNSPIKQGYQDVNGHFSIYRNGEVWQRLKAGGEGVKEDEMIGWHRQLNGCEFEQTPGGGEGQTPRKPGMLQFMGSHS